MSKLSILSLAFVVLLAACHRRPPVALSAQPPETKVPEANKVLPQEFAVASANPTSTSTKGTSPSSSPGTPSASAAAPAGISTVDPTNLAQIQSQFLATINSAIRKAEPGLKTPVTTFVANQARTVFAEYTGKFTYDIKRSDSIVSPLEGTVSWSVRWYLNGVASELPMTIDARYGYQNGRWVIKDLVRRVNNEKSLPADEYLPLFQ